MNHNVPTGKGYVAMHAKKNTFELSQVYIPVAEKTFREWYPFNKSRKVKRRIQLH